MISSSTSKTNNALSKLIISIDQMGLTPQFLIEGKHKYNTISGGILSILVYALSVLSCFFFGKELYLKRDPTVILSNYFENDPRPFNLTTKNFNFYVGIQGIDYNYYVDPSIYTLKMGINQILIKDSEQKEKVEFDYKINRIPMEKCNLTKHFDPSFQSLFKNQNLDNLLCLDPNRTEILPLAGSFGNANYQYIEFTVESCQNTTGSNIICKPRKVIDEKLQGGFFIVNYIETIFDPKNFSDPNVYIKRDFYTSMSNKFFKEISFSMKNIDYVSDIGILLSSEETRNFIQTDSIKEIYDFREANLIISAVFRLSFNRDVVKRRYLKLQNVIAQVGGFIKGIMLIFAFFNHFYSTTNFYIFLMNKLFSFEALELNEVSKKLNSFRDFNDNSDRSLRGKQNLYSYTMNKNCMIRRNYATNYNYAQHLKVSGSLREMNKANANFENNNKSMSNFDNYNRERLSLNTTTFNKTYKNALKKISMCNEKLNDNSLFKSNSNLNHLNKNIMEPVLNLNNKNDNNYNNKDNINNRSKKHENQINHNDDSNRKENLFEKIYAKNNENNQIVFNLREKIMLMFRLCFGFTEGNVKKNRKTFHIKKPFIFESCFEQIKIKFDAFKYLKIFDDIKLIKSFVFTEDQKNVVHLIGNTKHKFDLNSEVSELEIADSLKKITQSSNQFDKKIKLLLLDNQLL